MLGKALNGTKTGAVIANHNKRLLCNMLKIIGFYKLADP
jgi:hypothetical protein